jgi:ankyrin repeat protein
MGNGLIEAAMEGDLIKVRQFIANGVDVNTSNRLGTTALMVASLWNREPIVSLLLSHGADMEAKENSSGCNALMFACLSGNRNLVNTILKHGAAVNSANMDGRTALMMAAFCGTVDIVKMLLEGGADVDATDRFGATAVNQALAGGHTELAKLLTAKSDSKPLNVSNEGKHKGSLSKS